jgi:hypothetical protein
LVEVGKADKDERKKKKNEFVIFIFRFHSNYDNVSDRTGTKCENFFEKKEITTRKCVNNTITDTS